jgi:IS30 family transposase
MEKNLNRRNGHWTEEEKEILRTLIEARVPKTEIARRMGRGKEAVKTASARFGIKSEYPTNAWLPSEMEQLISLVAQNVPRQEIAATLNRTTTAVRKKMQCAGIQYPNPRQRRLWTQDEIEDLKKLCSLSLCIHEIAQILNRPYASVYIKCHTLAIEYHNAYEVEKPKPKPKQPKLRELLYGK